MEGRTITRRLPVPLPAALARARRRDPGRLGPSPGDGAGRRAGAGPSDNPTRARAARKGRYRPVRCSNSGSRSPSRQVRVAAITSLAVGSRRPTSGRSTASSRRSRRGGEPGRVAAELDRLAPRPGAPARAAARPPERRRALLRGPTARALPELARSTRARGHAGPFAERSRRLRSRRSAIRVRPRRSGAPSAPRRSPALRPRARLHGRPRAIGGAPRRRS